MMLTLRLPSQVNHPKAGAPIGHARYTALGPERALAEIQAGLASEMTVTSAGILRRGNYGSHLLNKCFELRHLCICRRF
jgi:hypothetical protein